jgi:hypothetical protein
VPKEQVAIAGRGPTFPNVRDDRLSNAWGHRQNATTPCLSGCNSQRAGIFIQIGQHQIGYFAAPETEIAHTDGDGVVPAADRSSAIEGGQKFVVLAVC